MSKKSRAFLALIALSIVLATIWHFTFDTNLINPNQWKSIGRFCGMALGLTAIEFAMRYYEDKRPRTLSPTAIIAILGITMIIMTLILTTISATTTNIVEAETLAFGQSSFGLLGFAMECLVCIISAMAYIVVLFKIEDKKAAQTETQ